MTQLTKQSSEGEIKTYFAGILKLSRSDDEFPVNLDDVWPLVYGQKSDAVYALINDDLFVQGVDYKVLRKIPQNLKGGRPTNTYMLSVPCLEFFIARKVRSVFEVYRQVFHKVAGGELVPPRLNGGGKDTFEDALAPLAQYHARVMARWQGVGESAAREECDKHFRAYRADICKLVCAETIARLDGREMAASKKPVAASRQVITSAQLTLKDEGQNVRQIIDDVYKSINWLHFVYAYMGKSYSWLSHKFENFHNGKPFPFKEGERVKFQFALVDISDRIRKVADKLSKVFHPSGTDATFEKPVLITDMKKRVKNINVVISWPTFARTYFNTTWPCFRRKMEGVDGEGGVGGFNELETDQMCDGLIDLANRIRRAAEDI